MHILLTAAFSECKYDSSDPTIFPTILSVVLYCATAQKHIQTKSGLGVKEQVVADASHVLGEVLVAAWVVSPQ